MRTFLNEVISYDCHNKLIAVIAVIPIRVTARIETTDWVYLSTIHAFASLNEVFCKLGCPILYMIRRCREVKHHIDHSRILPPHQVRYEREKKRKTCIRLRHSASRNYVEPYLYPLVSCGQFNVKLQRL